MDKQMTFDRVRDHMLRQNARSGIIEQGSLPQHRNSAVSAYRGTWNAKCAIGCLIPNGVYNFDMEGLPIRKVLDAFPRLKRVLHVETDEDVTFLEALQNVHDLILPQYWDENLCFVANKFKVSHPNADALKREAPRGKARRQ